MHLERLIRVGRGLEPADVVLKNARVVNVFSGEIQNADVAFCEDKIAGVGQYQGLKEYDLKGSYVTPGFIDAHMHVESYMVQVSEFARTALPLGTTAIVADPHEIANVMGTDGIAYILKSSKYNPLSVYVTLSSCVPASPLETSGAELDAIDLIGFFQDKWVLGLAEVMNFPGVLNGDPEVLNKIRIAKDKQIDGHAPGLTGLDLNGYIAAGINSDHECSTIEEAAEKLRLGMHIMIREGSVARNLKDLLPLVNDYTLSRIMFCTDDRTPLDLLTRGHINSMIRDAISSGISPVWAIRMATLNTAQYYKLNRVGGVAPGWMADVVVLDDLEKMTPRMVFKQGVLAAEDGQMVFPETARRPIPLRGSVNVQWLREEDFRIPAVDGKDCRVIRVIPKQLITVSETAAPKVVEGMVTPDIGRDLLKMVVIERHHATGNVGMGLVRGFGLKQGAIASSVAHDSHNLIVIGTNDHDIFTAAVQLVKMQGGLCAVRNGEVLESLPLPIGGLMSDKPLAEVCSCLEKLKNAAHSLGCTMEDPYMQMAFLSLPVIPDLKLTDRGLVDVSKFEIVPLFLN